MVNRPIPALFQGVSQQPAALRSLDQVEALENAYVSVADGARKRPPSQYIKHLTTSTPGAPKVHHYFRGDGEHNIILVDYDSNTHLGVVLAFDGETGTEKTVDTSLCPTALSAYINSQNAMDEIGMLTVADTTFLWNRTVVAATLASTLTAPTPILYVYVKEAQQNTDYSIWVGTAGGTTAAYNSGAGAPSTTAVALGLKTAIAALPDGATFTVTSDGPLLTIQKTDGSDFQFNANDSQGASLITALKNRVERYSDLPRYFTEGAQIQVQGEADVSGRSAFWVTFKRDTTHSTGYWEESVAPVPGEPTKFDPNTMPLSLVRQSDGNFKLIPVPWNERLVGSTSNFTCPIPSFVGGKITELFFYRNRLGILSGENVVMSRANSLFNFWPKTASAVLDDDPIDVTANSARVANLRHAIPFQRNLVLFSDNAQFVLTGGDTLTPKTVRLDQATEFDASALVSPVSSGEDLFFVFERSSSGAKYSGVREYFVNTLSITNDAIDITAHAPQYIPDHVFHASVSSTEDVLLLLTKTNWNQVYFYKYLWDGERRVQSAWGRWTFRGLDKIIAADVDKTTVHLVIQRDDGVHLERMNLQVTETTDTLPFQIHLDSLQLASTSPLPPSYDPLVNETTLWVPEGLTNTDPLLEVVAGGAFTSGAGARLKIVSTQGTQGVKVKGDWTAHPCYMGMQYAERITFSEQFMRDMDGRAIQQGRLQLKHFTVSFKDAVTFRAEVATPTRDVAVYSYTAILLGMAGSLIGAPLMRSGSWTFPVASKSTDATITLVNDSPYPATFYAAEWEGEFFTRSSRR